ncbi:MAG: hypothetical protein ACRDXE_00300, partial [Acidimicrobiales bacterium]
MRRASRRLLLVTVVAGAIWAIRSLLLVRSDRRSRRPLPGPWPPLPDPDQPAATTPPATTPRVATAPAAATMSPAAASPPTAVPNAAGRTWLEGTDDGTCPETHPVKVKLRSKLYHLPGRGAYERTHPDRCYSTAEDAEADGFARA